MTIKMMIMKSFLLVTLFISCQGQRTWEEEYPFIKKASAFASVGSSAVKTSSRGYDYIIIGGGTAGCPLAATLSQKYNVLLLERGDVPFDNKNVSFLKNFHINNLDSSPTSASQFFEVEGVFNVRPRVLGGGTSINAGFYTRPSLWSLRELGLDRDLAYQSYPWIERQIIYTPVLNVFQRAVGNALLQVGVTPNNGYTFEHLYGTKISGIMFDRDGRRHTAAELLQSANPRNLDVLIHAQVQKIVFDQSSNRRPRAVGVIFNDENGEQHRVSLCKDTKSEVILSSGAIGSPQLLLLSGIGPTEELAQMDIPVVLDNKHVGKEMADNPLNIVVLPFNRPVNQSLIQTVGTTRQGVYIEAESGFGQAPGSIHYTHDDDTTEEEKNEELPHESYNLGSLLSKVANPLSTGELTLNNTNAAENPNISFNYFSNPKDLETCVRGIRIIERLVSTRHLRNLMQPGNTFEKLLSLSVQDTYNRRPKTADATMSLEQFCRQTQGTIGHYHGGCHKGKVIDNDYKVLGVDGLRVIDGSTFVQSPGTNPQATLMMMGRYMGVKILRNRLGRAAGV